MELVLWQWSIAVQLSSLILITAFFVVLRRSLPHPSVNSWVRGWIFNLIALIVALFFWVLRTTDTTRPTGDHIDLWNGWRTSAKMLFPWFGWLGGYNKSSEIWFWEVK